MSDTDERKDAAVDEEDDSKIFPQRLMEILDDESNHDAICWLPHGRAFIIRKRDLFASKVMPKYFSRKAKYSSFTRKLNRWNFVRVSSGPELGAYYHEFFLRDKPQLAAQMFCKNARTMLAMANSETSTAAAAMPSNNNNNNSVAAAASHAAAVAAVAQGVSGVSLGPPAAAAPPNLLNVASPMAAAASYNRPSIPVTPALLAALTKEPPMPGAFLQRQHHQKPSLGSMGAYGAAPANLRLLEMHLAQQEEANRILLQHAMALSQQQREQQQQKLANDRARLAQMRQLMLLRQQQQTKRNANNSRASAA